MKVIVVDSFGLLYKSVYSKYVSDFDLESGQPVEYLITFLENILELSKTLNSNNFVFVFDSRRNLRKEVCDSYKMLRSVNDDDETKKRKERLRKQVPLLKRILIKAGFKNLFEQDGYEGDDMIASVINSNPDNEFVIVTGDNDILQCLRENVSIYFFNKSSMYTYYDFLNDYNNLEPSEFWRIKALAGCVSDNVKGIYKIGNKTALRYLQNELKEESKAYKKIKEEYDVFEYNTKLVKLPYEGTKPNIITNAKPTMDEICSALDYLELLPLLDESELKEWDMFVNKSEDSMVNLIEELFS